MCKLKLKANNSVGFYIYNVGGVLDLDYINSKTRRGRVQECGNISPTLCAESTPYRIEMNTKNNKYVALDEQNNCVRKQTFGCLTTDGSSPKHNNRVIELGKDDVMAEYRIRKLTPKECWRLMDFKDEDFEKAQEVNSNTRLYQQAGNSIVKNCLVAIFGQMFEGKEEVYKHDRQ